MNRELVNKDVLLHFLEGICHADECDCILCVHYENNKEEFDIFQYLASEDVQ